MFAVLLWLQTQVPGLPEHRVANIFKPFASPAQSEHDIAILTLAITAAIFLVVGGLIVFTIWKFRRKPGDDAHQEPAQVYGSNQIEVAWTVIPILIVFILIGVSARVIASVQNAGQTPSTLHVKIVGHQWWWEVQYPDFGIVTANEIHVPTAADGKRVTYLELTSVDVIHSFWIPQLSGKTDLIPNRLNYMWIDPREPGIFLGNCAEYCGTQHANMLLRVIAQTPEDFKNWTVAQGQLAATAAQVSDARTAFEGLSCVNCHMVKGTSAVGKFGPDLTHLMSRQTIGSGVLENNVQNIRTWVNDPQDPKPGCLMPSLKLTPKELDQVVTYLQSLN